MDDEPNLVSYMDIATVQLITMDLETIKALKDQAWSLYMKFDKCLKIVKMIEQENKEFQEMMMQEAQRPADEDE